MNVALGAGALFAGALLTAFASSAPSAGQPAPQPSMLLRVASDDISAAFIPGMITRFLTKHGATAITSTVSNGVQTFQGEVPSGSQLRVSLRVGTTGFALRRLARGEADVAAGIGVFSPSQLRVYANGTTRLGDPSPFANTALVLAVPPSNPINVLTYDEARAIFEGRIRNWSQLHGPPRSIDVYVRGTGAGTIDVFNRFLMGAGGKTYKSDTIPLPTAAAMARAMAADANAIGYLPIQSTGPLRHIQFRMRNGELGPFPDQYSLRSGDYPMQLTSTLYRKLPAPTTGPDPVADFYDEASSASTQVDLTMAGWSPLEPTLLPASGLDILNGTPSAYRDLTQRAIRVSTTIRFGSVAIKPCDDDAGPDPGQHLEDQTIAELQELAAYLRFLHEPSANVQEVAFSYNTGNARVDTDRSRRIGCIVRHKLLDLEAKPGHVLSLGSAAPLADDRLEDGKSVDLRVETWILP